MQRFGMWGLVDLVWTWIAFGGIDSTDSTLDFHSLLIVALLFGCLIRDEIISILAFNDEICSSISIDEFQPMVEFNPPTS